MLLLKKLDVYGQIILITTGIFFGFFEENKPYFLWYLVNIVQLISILAHLLFAGHLPMLKQRTLYQQIFFVLLSLFLLSIGIAHIFIILNVVLLFFVPILPFWYAYISFKELRNWEARDLIHFK